MPAQDLERPRDKTILIVEDEAIIALAEATMLKKNGYSVFTAYSGSSAVERISREGTIDLVLMDIDLGSGMDGTEAAGRILEEKKLPLLFLSSHTEPEIVEKTERISSYGYVTKNSGETVLVASIKMAFRLFEANRKLEEAIEAQKRIEVALRKSEAEFRSLFEAAPAGVGMLKNRLFTKVNDMMCETFGYAEAEMIGKGTRILYADDEEYERVGRELYGELRSHRRAMIETRLRKKDGTVIKVLVGASALDPGAADPIESVATVLFDLSGRGT